MRKTLLLVSLAAAVSANAAFTSGNLVVLVVSNGGNPMVGNRAYPISLREIRTDGTVVSGDVALPSIPSGSTRACTTQSQEQSEGGLHRSTDGRYLVVGGYNAVPGSVSPGGSADRTIARIDSNGVVDTTTGIPLAEMLFTTDSLRHVLSTDGNSFWTMSGSGGVGYTTFGSTSGAYTQITTLGPDFGANSCRGAVIYNGDIWYCSSDDYNGFGNSVQKLVGLPTTAQDQVVVLGSNGSARSLAFVDSTTMYYACSTAAFGIVKFKLIAGNWIEQYRTGAITGGVNNILLHEGAIYATTDGGSKVIRVIDTGTTFTKNDIYEVPANYLLRGLALAPSSTVTVSGTVNLQDFDGQVLGREVVIELKQNGNVIETKNVSLQGDGSYSFQTDQQGTFDIFAKASHWLRQANAGVVIGGAGASNVDFSLVNGDADPDNEVNLVDASTISNAFGSAAGDPNWNADADLDGDGEVNLVDWGILAARFGQAGDE